MPGLPLDLPRSPRAERQDRVGDRDQGRAGLDSLDDARLSDA
jgi:hypothetical protein